jgi:hypothetical protein
MLALACIMGVVTSKRVAEYTKSTPTMCYKIDWSDRAQAFRFYTNFAEEHAVECHVSKVGVPSYIKNKEYFQEMEDRAHW